jgi:hypothetical protein
MRTTVDMARAFEHRTVAQHRPEWPHSTGVEIDAQAVGAGPGLALVADEDGVYSTVRFDVERGTPIDEIPPRGFIS